jgi:hypothetical protein
MSGGPRISIPDDAEAPDISEQLLPGEDPGRLGGQGAEQGELLTNRIGFCSLFAPIPVVAGR